MHLEFPAPTISVDLEDLYGSRPKDSRPVIASKVDTEHSLTVRPWNDAGVIFSDFPANKNNRPRPLELQNIDFMGPSEVVKSLLCLPYSEKPTVFALHKLGNTLLVDSLVSDVDLGKQSSSGPSFKKSPRQETISNDDKLASQWVQRGDMLNHTIEGMLATMSTAPNLIGSSTSSEENLTEYAGATDSPSNKETPNSTLQSGSPYLPPPGFFMPGSPHPFR